MRLERCLVAAAAALLASLCAAQPFSKEDFEATTETNLLEHDDESSIELDPFEDYKMAVETILETTEDNLVMELESAATEEDRKLAIETFVSDSKDNMQTYKNVILTSHPLLMAEFDKHAEDVQSRLDTIIAKHVPQRRSVIGQDSRSLISSIWKKPLQMGINLFRWLTSLSDTVDEEADDIYRRSFRVCGEGDFMRFKSQLKQLIDSNVHHYLAALKQYSNADLNTEEFRAVLVRKVDRFTDSALANARHCDENFQAFKRVALKVSEELLRFSQISNRPYHKVDVEAQRSKKLCEINKSEFNINCKF